MREREICTNSKASHTQYRSPRRKENDAEEKEAAQRKCMANCGAG